MEVPHRWTVLRRHWLQHRWTSRSSHLLPCIHASIGRSCRARPIVAKTFARLGVARPSPALRWNIVPCTRKKGWNLGQICYLRRCPTLKWNKNWWLYRRLNHQLVPLRWRIKDSRSSSCWCPAAAERTRPTTTARRRRTERALAFTGGARDCRVHRLKRAWWRARRLQRLWPLQRLLSELNLAPYLSEWPFKCPRLRTYLPNALDQRGPNLLRPSRRALIIYVRLPCNSLEAL